MCMYVEMYVVFVCMRAMYACNGMSVCVFMVCVCVYYGFDVFLCMCVYNLRKCVCLVRHSC